MDAMNKFTVLRQRCLGERLLRILPSAKTVSASLKSASFLRQSPVVNYLLFTCSLLVNHL